MEGDGHTQRQDTGGLVQQVKTICFARERKLVLKETLDIPMETVMKAMQVFSAEIASMITSDRAASGAPNALNRHGIPLSQSSCSVHS